MKLLVKSSDGFHTVIIDECDSYLSKWKWHLGTDGSVARNRRNGQERRIHRIIMGAKKGEYVDHINHNPLDNRRENLRICTNQENNWNKPPTAGKKYKGTSRNPASKKNPWCAFIKKDYKSLYLGSFKTEEMAALEYNKFAKELFGEFAYLNAVPTGGDYEG